MSAKKRFLDGLKTRTGDNAELNSLKDIGNAYSQNSRWYNKQKKEISDKYLTLRKDLERKETEEMTSIVKEYQRKEAEIMKRQKEIQSLSK